MFAGLPTLPGRLKGPVLETICQEVGGGEKHPCGTPVVNADPYAVNAAVLLPYLTLSFVLRSHITLQACFEYALECFGPAGSEPLCL